MGNNDRGTLIVPDHGVDDLEKDVNVLWVQYKPDLCRPFIGLTMILFLFVYGRY